MGERHNRALKSLSVTTIAASPRAGRCEAASATLGLVRAGVLFPDRLVESVHVLERLAGDPAPVERDRRARVEGEAEQAAYLRSAERIRAELDHLGTREADVRASLDVTPNHPAVLAKLAAIAEERAALTALLPEEAVEA